MKIAKFIFYVVLLAVLASCGKADGDRNTVAGHQSQTADNTETADMDLLNTVYNKFVFAVGSDGINPEQYFTPDALKRLQAAYGLERGNGSHYAYYELRTGAQDAKPGVDTASKIYNIEPEGDGWYVVSYADMGWPGKTRVRIVDGKIDAFERLDRQLSD